MYSKFSILFLFSSILFVGCNDTPEPQAVTKDCLVTGISYYIDTELYGTDTLIYTTGSLISEINTVYSTWLESEDLKTSFIYDDVSRLKKIEFFDGATKSYYYSYGYSNNIIHRHRYTSTNGIDFTLRNDSIQFILNGATVQSFISYNAGVVDAKESYEYDTKGNVKKVTEFKTDGSINKTYTIEYKTTGINPNFIAAAGGLRYINYSSLSPHVPTMVDGTQVDSSDEYNDDGYVVTQLYYNGAEPWWNKYRYACKD